MNQDIPRSHLSPFTVIFFGASLILSLLQWKSCDDLDKAKGKDKLYEQSQAKLKTYKDQDSLNHGQIELMYGTIANFKGLRAKDSSEIARLQKLVDKNTISATIFSSVTSSTVTGHTTITFPGIPGKNATTGRDNDIEHPAIDSNRSILLTQLPCDSSCFPVYGTHYENKWENVDVVATKDSIQVKYMVFNDYSIVQKFEKRGSWPFRKEYPIIDILNNNPRTHTTALRAFTVEPPKAKNGRWFVAGAILGAIAVGVVSLK